MPVEGERETQEILKREKQTVPPVTSTSTGKAITPPQSSVPRATPRSTYTIPASAVVPSPAKREPWTLEHIANLKTSSDVRFRMRSFYYTVKQQEFVTFMRQPWYDREAKIERAKILTAELETIHRAILQDPFYLKSVARGHPLYVSDFDPSQIPNVSTWPSQTQPKESAASSNVAATLMPMNPEPTQSPLGPAISLMKGETGQIDSTTQFWQGLGYPQYIGRYAPFEIPSGYKVSKILEQGNELQITFAPSESPLVLQGLKHSLGAFAVEGQQQYVDTLKSKTVVLPGLQHSLKAFEIEGQQSLLDLQAKEFAESDYGKLVAEVPALKTFVESAAKRGRPAPTFIVTTVTEQKPTAQEAYQQYHDVRMPELLKAESESFYTKLGYPEYGGKYGTFNVPAGYKVQSIAQQGSNLAVTFEALPTPPTQTPKGSVGLALKAIPFLTSVGQSIAKPFVEGADVLKYNLAHPIEALSPELPSYPVTLEEKRILQERTDVAVFGLSTAALAVAPVLIPLKLGGSVAIGLGARTLLASGIGAASGYYYGGVQGAEVGALLGGAMYLGAVGLSHGLSRVVQKSIQGSYESSVQAGELWKPSTFQKLGMAVTGAKPKPLAPSIVGLPSVEEGALISAPYETTTIEGGQLVTKTVIPSSTQKWAGGLDVFEMTNAPRTSGFGLTEPTPIAPAIEVPNELPLVSLSNALRPTPQSELSFTKEPQTYREAQKSDLSFSKQHGELPSQEGLLQQIATQEAKSVALSGPMENVFGPAAIQKTATLPVVAVTLGDMTSWLQKQETQAKTVQGSAVTPLSLGGFQSQVLKPQTKQTEETLTFLSYPGQALGVNVPSQQKKEVVVSPLLDLGFLSGMASLPKIGTVVAPKSTVSPSLSLMPSSILDVVQSPIAKDIVSPLTRVAVTPKTINITKTLPVSPSPTRTTLTLPKNPLSFGGGVGSGRKAGGSSLFLFGRQPRKYPIMSGGEAAKFLYRQPAAKRKKK